MIHFPDRLEEKPGRKSCLLHPGHFGEGLEVGCMGRLQFRPIQLDRFTQNESTVFRLTRIVVTFQAGKLAHLGPNLVHEVWAWHMCIILGLQCRKGNKTPNESCCNRFQFQTVIQLRFPWQDFLPKDLQVCSCGFLMSPIWRFFKFF